MFRNALATRISFIVLGFPCGSDGKEFACNVGDLGSITGLGRSPGEGKGNPSQYSGLENPMDRGARWSKSMGSQRVRHNWIINYSTYLYNYKIYFHIYTDSSLLLVTCLYIKHIKIWAMKPILIEQFPSCKCELNSIHYLPLPIFKQSEFHFNYSKEDTSQFLLF